MDKHSIALIALNERDTTRSTMREINVERYFNQKIRLDVLNLLKLNPEDEKAQFTLANINLSIVECERKYKEQMDKYFDSMKYLEVYNDEFNKSSKWKKWMAIRPLKEN
jgi:hypothetical protein